MIKITLLLSAFLALSTAFELYNESVVPLAGCQSQTELWGSSDGTKFYFCLPGTDTAIEQSCEEGTFFVKNATVSGCLPLNKVDGNCVNVDAAAPLCTGDALRSPLPSSDPTKFYFCTGEGSPPIQGTCAEGKAFVEQDGYLGCFEWTDWREIKECPQ